MNPVYHELKGLVSFVKKAESVKSLQYCLEQSGKWIVNFFCLYQYKTSHERIQMP